jgi:hypothetical protein
MEFHFFENLTWKANTHKPFHSVVIDVLISTLLDVDVKYRICFNQAHFKVRCFCYLKFHLYPVQFHTKSWFNLTV